MCMAKAARLTRTNIVLDEDLVAEATRLTGIPTRRALVHEALRALVEQHTQELSPILAPLVNGQRANPVLFDRRVFKDLMALSGDVGGRKVFSKYQVAYLPWHDESLLLDVDTQEDLQRLRDQEV